MNPPFDSTTAWHFVEAIGLLLVGVVGFFIREQLSDIKVMLLKLQDANAVTDKRVSVLESIVASDTRRLDHLEQGSSRGNKRR